MRTKRSIRCWAAVLGVWLVGATGAWAKLNVVATMPDLGSIAAAIGGSELDLTTLARPTEDPHFIDPRPSFIVKLNRADVLIHGGAELEAGWLPALLKGARNPAIEPGGPGELKANTGVQMLEVPASLDRSGGDIHAAGNPHFLVDPLNAMIVATNIVEVFCRLDAKSAETYRANFLKFVGELERKLPEWQKRLEPYRGQSVVGYHNAWPYFARRFGLRIDLFLEPKPGIPPTPAHLAEVIGNMRKQHARVIIVDRYLNRRTAEAVAERTGAKVVDVTHYPGGVKGTEAGYVALIDYLVNSLAGALGS